MPTIMIIGKLKFMIYFRDHGVAHVHVIGPGAEAKIILENQIIVSSKGFTPKELRPHSKSRQRTQN